MLSASPPATITANVAVTLSGKPHTVSITVPAGKTRLDHLLPVFHALASTIVDRAEAEEAAAGRTVSCRAGCGACCRQPVPVSPSEARGLAALVAAMPEPRRGAVRRRFAAAQAALAAAGVETRPEAIARLAPGERRPWGQAYFTKQVACPFLDAESCSIHRDRPAVCREYLVTTPAANCDAPTAEMVRRVPLPAQVSAAVAATDLERGHGLLLLVDSLDWAAVNPAPPPRDAGLALVRAVFARLAAQV